MYKRQGNQRIGGKIRQRQAIPVRQRVFLRSDEHDFFLQDRKIGDKGGCRHAHTKTYVQVTFGYPTDDFGGSGLVKMNG